MRITIPSGSIGEERGYGERRIVSGYIVIEIEESDSISSINGGKEILINSGSELTVLFRGLDKLSS